MSNNGSCWYIRLQGVLYLLAFLTYGLGDAVTSLLMIENRGIMVEANPIVRYMIINYGTSSFIAIKLWFTAVILLFIPFLIQKNSREPVYWMINGYLVSLIVAGTLAIILNIQAARNEAVLFSPEQVIFLFLILVLILTNIGEKIDRAMHPKIRGYFYCALHDVAVILTLINRLKKN